MALCGVQQGNDITYEVIVADDTGPIDITTGFTVQFIMKTNINKLDSEGLPKVLGPVTAAKSTTTTGLATITLDAADTAQLETVKYYYEVRLYDTRLTPTTVYTLEKGTLFVSPQVFN